MAQFEPVGGVFSPKPGVVACELGNGLALLDPDSGIYYSLNDVGRFLWQQLSRGPSTSGTLCSVLLDHYDCAAESALNDVNAVLIALRSADLVQVGSVDNG